MHISELETPALVVDLAVMERNLDRITYFIGVVWAVSIIALGLLLKG